MVDEQLSALILELVPENGSSIRNVSLLAAIRARRPGVSDEDYSAARDALVAAGVLGRARGRGGSVYRVADAAASADGDGDDVEEASAPDDDAEDEAAGEPDGFVLNAAAATPAGRRGRGGVRRGVKAAARPEVVSYLFADKRLNNPEVRYGTPRERPG